MSAGGEIDLTVAHYASITRMCHISATCIVLWDYALTFGDEVDFVWKRKWSKGSFLFFWNRYFGLGFSLFNAAGILHPSPSHHFCATWFDIQSLGSLLHILTTHIILELRLYALFRRKKWVLWFFILLTAAELASTLYFFNGPEALPIRTNQPGKGVYLCSDADPQPMGHIFWYFVQSTLIEGVLVVFVLHVSIASMHFREKHGIVDCVLTDNILYFGCVFTVYLINTFFWRYNILALNESLTGYFFGVPFVLSNRLLLNIRVAYFGRDDYYASWGSMADKSRPSGIEFVHSTAQETRSTGLTIRRRRTQQEIERESFCEDEGW